MRQTGEAYRGPRHRRFPPGIERIVRRRRWSAWTAVAALAVVGDAPEAGHAGMIIDAAAVSMLSGYVLRLTRRFETVRVPPGSCPGCDEFPAGTACGAFAPAGFSLWADAAG